MHNFEESPPPPIFLEFFYLIKFILNSINVTEMWTIATSMPKRGCPPLVLDNVLRSEDSENTCQSMGNSPNKQLDQRDKCSFKNNLNVLLLRPQ